MKSPGDGSSLKVGRDLVGLWLRQQDKARPIRRVVDFGCGAGDQGRFLRKCLPRLSRLVGVDIWPPTIARRKQDRPPIYNELVLADFRGLLTGQHRGLLQADLWFFGDCLEHVELTEAQAILNLAGGATLIAARIPAGRYTQGASGGNEAERHLWTFYPDMLDAWKLKRPVLNCVTACSEGHAQKTGCSLYLRGSCPRHLIDQQPRFYISNLLLGPLTV